MLSIYIILVICIIISIAVIAYVKYDYNINVGVLIIIEDIKRITLNNWDNLSKQLDILIPKESRYLIIVLFWLFLLLQGNISQIRLIIFIVILIGIYIYKWLYENILKLYVHIEKAEVLLLKIDKYKNPLIWLLIELEIKVFYILYNLEKRNVKPLYIKLISKILYNFTGINGIKIIFYKLYNILKYWLTYKMYELVFQRMFGMILSILIFTDIIKKGLEILNLIYPSNIVWIYISLIIIPYIFNVYDINTILRNRRSVNLIWKILKEIDIKLSDVGNINVKAFLGFSFIVKVLNYENAIIYLICDLDTNKAYNNILLYYCAIIYECFDNFIHIRNMELKKETCNKDVLNCCEYGILLNKLRVFYFWDIGKQLGIQETLLKIDLSIKSKDVNVNDISTIPAGLSTHIIFLYDYNLHKFMEIYNDKIKNIKLDKFFNIIENKQFHEKYIHYINDNEFKNKLNKINVYDNIQYHCISLEEHMISLEADNYRDWYTLEEIKQLIFESKQELNDWRAEWLKLNVENDLEYKYEIIFNKIEEIKKKYKTNV